jgi:hypothetical protein
MLVEMTIPHGPLPFAPAEAQRMAVLRPDWEKRVDPRS